MKNYQDLQTLYSLPEISENCVAIDVAFGFICAIASSEVEIENWMPMLFLDENCNFSNEQVAGDFAQVILATHQQAMQCFQEQTPLILATDSSEASKDLAISNFANGYLQAEILIDNMQTGAKSAIANDLQQTCLLLLDKLASYETDDVQKLAVFKQLPSESEIIGLLPVLLSRYGHQCLVGKSSC